MTAVTTENKTMVKGEEKMSNKKQAPKQLKKIRFEEGYSIYSLAAALGVNFSTVSYWENGVKHPRHKMIMQLEDMFKVSYRELFSDLSEAEAADLEQRMEEQRKNPDRQQ